MDTRSAERGMPRSKTPPRPCTRAAVERTVSSLTGRLAADGKLTTLTYELEDFLELRIASTAVSAARRDNHIRFDPDAFDRSDAWRCEGAHGEQQHIALVREAEPRTAEEGAGSA